MVGGATGRQRDETNKVVIGVGLGQFSEKTKLSSLHTSFQSYFVKKARALGYIVVGVNEYYTSKKCPTCRQFVGQVEIRRLYCKTCKTYMHRDVMAGHNICNVARGHLMNQRRPLYLQPVDAEGNYVWEQPSMRLQTYFGSNGGSSTSSSTGNSSSSSSSHSSLVSFVGQDESLRLKRIASEGQLVAFQSEEH